MAVLNLLVTERCNLSCPHCYVCGASPGNATMSKEQVGFLLQRFHPVNLDMVHVFGGEPFIHPDIKEIVTAINEEGLHVNIATNGTLLEGHLPWLHRADVSLSINMLDAGGRLEGMIGWHHPIDAVIDATAKAIEDGIPLNGITCPLPVDGTIEGIATRWYTHVSAIHQETGCQDFFILYLSRLGRAGAAWSVFDHDLYTAAGWPRFLSATKKLLNTYKAPFNVYCEPVFENPDFPDLPPSWMQCESMIRSNIFIGPDMIYRPCVLMYNDADPCFKMMDDGKKSTSDIFDRFIKERHLRMDYSTSGCGACVLDGECSPCLPYMQDKKRDYRCELASKESVAFGCPLVTVPLFRGSRTHY